MIPSPLLFNYTKSFPSIENESERIRKVQKTFLEEIEPEQTQRPRLYIFVGAYGSGKSEVSVNFARMLKSVDPDQKVLIADLDIVNPFFRSADAAEILNKENIRLIAPNYANTNVDAPTVTGEMFAIFDDESYVGVFDIGGEDLGAKILASMHSRFKNIDYRMYMVVNTCRPFTADSTGILKMASELEASSRLKIHGFIDNSNLLEITSEESLIESYPILQEAVSISGIPLVFSTGLDENLPEKWKEFTEYGVPLLRMERLVLYND